LRFCWIVAEEEAILRRVAGLGWVVYSGGLRYPIDVV
jgi:hypothetical protein